MFPFSHYPRVLALVTSLVIMHVPHKSAKPFVRQQEIILDSDQIIDKSSFIFY
jgi:hypothetical protein